MGDKVPVTYIVNWPYHEHREMPKRAMWAKAKVDFQCGDWRKIARDDDRYIILATWDIVRGLALISPMRGLLLDDTAPPIAMTAREVAEASRFDLDGLCVGLKKLDENLSWTRTEVVENSSESFAELSRRLWGKVYSSKQFRHAQTSRKHREGSAKLPQKSREEFALNNTIHNNTKQTTSEVGGVGVLDGLSLFAADTKLVARWGELFAQWERAYPGVDVMAEVVKAHAWELSQPPSKRKQDHARFLHGWLARTAKDRGPVRPLKGADLAN